jgi:hypothetical protein
MKSTTCRHPEEARSAVSKDATIVPQHEMKERCAYSAYCRGADTAHL